MEYIWQPDILHFKELRGPGSYSLYSTARAIKIHQFLKICCKNLNPSMGSHCNQDQSLILQGPTHSGPCLSLNLRKPVCPDSLYSSHISPAPVLLLCKGCSIAMPFPLLGSFPSASLPTYTWLSLSKRGLLTLHTRLRTPGFRL